MPEHRFPNHFTVDEAQRWIPQLRELLAEIHEALEAVQGDVEILRKQTRRYGGNGGGIDAPNYFSADAALERALSTIQEAGIVIQDLERGLVDFPHLDGEGDEVFLCWELSDGERIEWYHPLHTGYAGRRRLPR